MPVTAFQVLCSKYQKGWVNNTFTQKLPIAIFFCSVSSATYLATYIVDLILVFYEISTVMTVHPPKSLSTDLVMDALATYKSRSPHVHGQVKEIAFTLEPEEKIASVIRDALPPRAAGSTIAYNKTSPWDKTRFLALKFLPFLFFSFVNKNELLQHWQSHLIYQIIGSMFSVLGLGLDSQPTMVIYK